MVLKDDIFFIRLKSPDVEKKESCTVVVLRLVSTIRGTKLNVKTRTTTLTKIAFPQITTIWKKRCDACKKKNVRCDNKTTFHYKGKLQELFRVGLNETTYNYVDSKQHFCLQYHVSATDIKALRKKQTTLQAEAYLGFRAHGDKLSLGAPTQPVRGSIKWKKHCNMMLYLQLSNSKRTKFSCFCCWKCIDYFVKKLTWFKYVTYFNLKNI